MRLSKLLTIGLCVCAVVGVLALATIVPLDAAVRPPKLQYQTTVLSNGLRVILSEDHSTPIVHLAVWYHCLLYTSPSPRDGLLSRMPSSA